MTKDDFTIVLTLFLGAALLFYTLFGGADYGAGILELFKGSHLRKEQEKLIGRVMGPVWEANHIWLIIVIVIMFMGFPEAFALVSTYLHLPLTAVLFGIVARGCAFTFRHYDAYHEERSQRVYTRFFEYASVWTPFWLGVTAGALSLGRINPRATTSWELFVAPWCNLFSFATGLFAVCLFAFLAAIYLIAESETEEMRILFRRRALAANGAAVLAGGLVFVSAVLSGVNLWKDFHQSGLSLICLSTATILLGPLWYSVRNGRGISARVLAGAQMVCVLVGWFGTRFPTIVELNPASGMASINVFAAAAPIATIQQLVWALVAGLALILPALIFLLSVFRQKQKSPVAEATGD